MKESVHYVVEAILAIAVIILFCLTLSGKKSTSKATPVSDAIAGTESSLPVAYVDIDSLMSNYNYAIDLNEQIIKKYENLRANLTEKGRKLQIEVDDFQRKWQTGSFLSQERAQSEQQRLLKKQEDLQNQQAKYEQELVEEQQRLTEELRKTLISNLQEFNQNKGYQIVYGKQGNNILIANNAYDITAEIIEFLNNKYSASPLAKPEE